jgi:hypothetical protein
MVHEPHHAVTLPEAVPPLAKSSTNVSSNLSHIESIFYNRTALQGKSNISWKKGGKQKDIQHGSWKST